MKELFKSLQDCFTMVMSIQTLQKKKSRTEFDRKDLEFRKEVLPFYLDRLKRVIDEYKTKKED